MNITHELAMRIVEGQPTATARDRARSGLLDCIAATLPVLHGETADSERYRSAFQPGTGNCLLPAVRRRGAGRLPAINIGNSYLAIFICALSSEKNQRRPIIWRKALQVV